MGAKPPTGEAGQSCSLEKTSGPDWQQLEWHCEKIEIAADRCQCGACPRCGAVKGYKVAKRVKPAIDKMANAAMFTFTLVPGQWAGGPDEAYSYIKAKNCIAEWGRSMWKRGLLNSKHYFCAEEFQTGERKENGEPGTGMVHYHVLVDLAVEIPTDERGWVDRSHIAQKRWDMFRPETAIKLGDWRDTTFGMVHCEKIDNAEGIANYINKYISKGPKGGLPEWYQKRLDEKRTKYLVGHSVSKGFWKWAGEVRKSKNQEPSECKAVKSCRTAESKRRHVVRPWRERLASCGTGAYLRKVTATIKMGVEGFHNKRFEYVGRLTGSFQDYKKAFFDARDYAADVTQMEPIGSIPWPRIFLERVQSQVMGNATQLPALSMAPG